MITGNQIKAARALSGLSQKELAEKSNISVNTIRSMEARENNRVRVRTETLFYITAAFQGAGVELMDNGGVQPFDISSFLERTQETIDALPEGITIDDLIAGRKEGKT